MRPSWRDGSLRLETADWPLWLPEFSRDIEAVRWTSSLVEGHIKRLKTLKRQMYGRAGYALLRSRVRTAA
ncbi:hypothetical protein EV129_13029 [Rhizobium azibense]|uniref:Transposase n=2 Tax=Rhizobium azibense TaxID=1136135 RepID=A0A4V6P187_9HYPH|nr:hypothetical protein EV129_13029 [Rhizobium azibense]